MEILSPVICPALGHSAASGRSRVVVWTLFISDKHGCNIDFTVSELDCFDECLCDLKRTGVWKVSRAKNSNFHSLLSFVRSVECQG